MTKYLSKAKNAKINENFAISYQEKNFVVVHQIKDDAFLDKNLK